MILVSWLRVSMKFIISNVATQMGNLLSFCMVVLVEVEAKLSEDSLIRRLIELLCLIKEDVAEVNLMPV